MTFQILELQTYRLLNKTNKQTNKHNNSNKKSFGVNHVCIALDIFEIEASKVTLVMRDEDTRLEGEEVGPSGRCLDLVV